MDEFAQSMANAMNNKSTLKKSDIHNIELLLIDLIEQVGEIKKEIKSKQIKSVKKDK